jgi:N-acetylglutamate synthase-like GNAT family acetyltransferase
VATAAFWHKPGSAEGHLVNVATAESMRSRGVGTQIVHAVEATARMQGLTRLSLTASYDSPGFYAKLGYRRDSSGGPLGYTKPL